MSTGTLTASALNPTPDIKAVVNSTGSMLTTISTAESSLQALSLPPSANVPNLAQHFSAAHDSATTWDSSVKPAVKSAISGLVGFSSQFNAVYPHLSTNATALQANANNATAAAAFTADIDALLAQAQTISNLSTQAQNELAAFQTANAALVRNFQSDVSTVQAQEQADEIAVQTLERQMDSLQQQLMQAEEKKAILENPGIVIITFGLSEVVALITNLQGQIANLQQGLGQSQSQESQEQSELMTLSSMAQALGSTLTLTTTLQASVMNYLTSWQSMSDNIKQLQELANISPSDGWALQDLEAVNSEWAVIAKEASTFN
jgi:hypothetical protein